MKMRGFLLMLCCSREKGASCVNGHSFFLFVNGQEGQNIDLWILSGSGRADTFAIV